jgi:hypothetical protein
VTQDGLYRKVPGIPESLIFWQPDFQKATFANRVAGRVLGVLARHAGAPNVAHVCMQLKQYGLWEIPEEIVAAGLFA